MERAVFDGMFDPPLGNALRNHRWPAGSRRLIFDWKPLRHIIIIILTYLSI
jgi:hypothetical protein